MYLEIKGALRDQGLLPIDAVLHVCHSFDERQDGIIYRRLRYNTCVVQDNI